MTNFLSRIFVKGYNNPKDPKVRARFGTFSSIVGIVVNLLLAGVKITLGIITLSVAVIADALNNFSDAASSIVTLVSFKMAEKPADRDHPFGHARIEYIASMIVSFLILLVGFELFTSSLSAIFDKGENSVPDFSLVTLIIIGSTIVFKLWLSFFYRTVGKKIDSSVVKASSVDSLLDCISTSAVLISGILVKITSFAIIDSIVGILISALIFIAGLKILNETKNSLLGEAPLNSQVDDIKKIVAEYPEILGIHDLIIHNYGPNSFIASFHAEVDGAGDIYALHDLIDNVEKRISEELQVSCTVHMDPVVTDDETLNELKAFVCEVIANEVDNSITIHDFRAVTGVTHTNLIFDVVLPFESKHTPSEIADEISAKILAKRENCYCVITVDRG